MGFFSGIGPAIIFVSVLLASIIVGVYVLAYASHCFLVVVEGTAAGMDEVRWPDEPFVDWLWKPIFLVGSLAFWATVAGLALLLAAPELVESWLGRAGVLFVAAWILFPVGLYSALSAQSVMYPLYWPLLCRLARRLPELVFVYLLTGPLIAGSLALLYKALLGDWWWLLAAALLFPLALFLHARLLGRLAWLIGYRTPIEQRKKRARRGNPFKKLKIEVVDPWSVPEEEKAPAHDEAASAQTDGADGELRLQEPYGLMSVEQARQSWEKKPVDQPVEQVYELAPVGAAPVAAAAEGSAPPAQAAPRPPAPAEPPLKEELLRLENEEPPPRYVFFSGVLTFLYYPRTLGPLAGLVLGGLFEVGLLRLLVSLKLG